MVHLRAGQTTANASVVRTYPEPWIERRRERLKLLLQRESLVTKVSSRLLRLSPEQEYSDQARLVAKRLPLLQHLSYLCRRRVCRFSRAVFVLLVCVCGWQSSAAPPGRMQRRDKVKRIFKGKPEPWGYEAERSSHESVARPENTRVEDESTFLSAIQQQHLLQRGAHHMYTRQGHGNLEKPINRQSFEKGADKEDALNLNVALSIPSPSILQSRNVGIRSVRDT